MTGYHESIFELTVQPKSRPSSRLKLLGMKLNDLMEQLDHISLCTI